MTFFYAALKTAWRDLHACLGFWAPEIEKVQCGEFPSMCWESTSLRTFHTLTR